MFEVLIYLFENYMGSNIMLNLDQQRMVTELKLAGFHPNAIHCALDWLNGLIHLQSSKEVSLFPPKTINMRHYSSAEKAHISIEGRGFILYLEQLGILDPVTREIVIDRLMALNAHEVNYHIKAVVFIVLLSQPKKKSELSLLQDILLKETFDVLH